MIEFKSSYVFSTHHHVHTLSKNKHIKIVQIPLGDRARNAIVFDCSACKFHKYITPNSRLATPTMRGEGVP